MAKVVQQSSQANDAPSTLKAAIVEIVITFKDTFASAQQCIEHS